MAPYPSPGPGQSSSASSSDGFRVQGSGFRTSRRSFLRAGSIGLAMLGARVPARAEEESEILRRAGEGIEKNRKADGVIAVKDRAGRPAAGAKVRVDQLRHAFLFGCNFFNFERVRAAELERAYRDRFAALFNFATLPFYWASYEGRRGAPGYDYSDRAAAWCREHGIQCKGHPLAWDQPAGNPGWLPDDPAEIGKLSVARVREIIGRFKGRIGLWDVVNEPTHLDRAKPLTRIAKWAVVLGPAEFVRRHLLAAREADPAATLLVNDYRLDPPFAAILKELDGGGARLFDAIGLQSHMHDHPWPLARVVAACDAFAGFGRPLHFTETTVVSGPRRGPGENWGPTQPDLEARQADYVEKLYTVLFGHPATAALTWWDFSDYRAWQGAAAGFLRADMSPKPVYERLLKLIRGAWWTKAEGVTNERGEFRLRAFAGLHKISAEGPAAPPATAEADWTPGAANRVEMKLA